MTRRRKYAFYADEDQLAGLKRIKARDGVLESETIRRALDAWLRKKGVVKVDRKRKRS